MFDDSVDARKIIVFNEHKCEALLWSLRGRTSRPASGTFNVLYLSHHQRQRRRHGCLPRQPASCGANHRNVTAQAFKTQTGVEQRKFSTWQKFKTASKIRNLYQKSVTSWKLSKKPIRYWKSAERFENVNPRKSNGNAVNSAGQL
jgi:hypothetical protein